MRSSKVLQGGLRQVADLAGKAAVRASAKRDSILLLFKAVIAATAAWIIANDLVGAPSPTFAPFSALLMVQATISGSLRDSVRFAGAMVSGVLLAGLMVPLLGTSTGTFAGIVLLTSALGRWRKLAPYGPQMAVAALFAFAAFTQSGTSTSGFVKLASIVGLVVFGCLTGVVTNLLIVPPLRYRSAEYGIGALSGAMAELLTDASKGMAEGVPDQEQAEKWRERATWYPDMVSQARKGVETVAEQMRFNPRRVFQRSSSSYEGHRVIINALERTSRLLLSAMTSLTSISLSDDPLQQEHDHFCVAYSRLLDVLAEAVRVLEGLRRPEDTEHGERLSEAVDRARTAYIELAEQSTGRQLDGPDQWPVYGSLQTDARRLIEEFAQAQRSLSQLTFTPRGYAPGK
ncbi:MULTISPECIES: FUSC family protein [Streptomyces]|uniref:FUSC family protein n=1 Tax=Streptomyces TaxID=1883 RepID=UPI00068D1C90|nr:MULTISPECIES: hypothetical protein [Streptomyces]